MKKISVVAVVFASLTFAVIQSKDGVIVNDKVVVETIKVNSYPAELIRVIDGDTYEMKIKIWEDIFLIKRVRLLGLDTPELRPRKGSEEEKIKEKARALKAKEFVISTFEGKELSLIYTWKSDSFGRVLGIVSWNDGKNTINEELRVNGHIKE